MTKSLKCIYKIMLGLHKLRLKSAKGWRKAYLTYLTPPVDTKKKKFCNWFKLKEFRAALLKEHKDLLTFPFAQQIYTLDYLLCSVFLGACNENYFRFLFYRTGWKARKKHITSRRLNFIAAQLNKAEKRIYLDDKVKFANHWNSFFNRRFCSIQDPMCTRESFAEMFHGCDKLIVKPLAGMRGQEIQIVAVDRSLSDIYDELKADSDEKIVEEYIRQTGLLHSFNPSSLNTVRVITLRDGAQITVLSSTLRVGGKDALIDNLHAGGMGYTVCTENGTIHAGISMTGKECFGHPETGIPVAGCVIPQWEKVKQFCEDAHRIAPEGLDYIGWDVCISEDKLYMIEGNACPGASPCVEEQDFWKIICRYFDNHPEMVMKVRHTKGKNKMENTEDVEPSRKSFLHKVIRFGKRQRKRIKKYIQKRSYECLRKIHKFRIRRAKGWKKVYLTYLTSPKMKSPSFANRYQFERLVEILEQNHSDRLRFPFARQYYKLDFFLSAFFLGISCEYYFGHLFYNHGWKYRNRHITSRRLLFIYEQLNKKDVLCFLNDKKLFADHWRDFFNRTFCVVHDAACTREQFLDLFKNSEKLIVKPLDGRGGKGIQVVDVDNNLEDIFNQLKACDEQLLVEEYIQQTGLIHEFNPSSLNTLRVITLRDHETVTVVSSYLRVGREGSAVDNLHSGGAGFTVYDANGKVYSGISLEGKMFSVHPDTGMVIAGQTIPRWEEVMQFCEDAHRAAPEGLDYIGWDVCVTDDKLYMIEGNAYPGASACVEDQDFWKIICEYFNRHPEMELVPKHKC